MISKCHEKRKEYAEGLCKECYHKYIYLHRIVRSEKQTEEMDKNRLISLKNRINQSLRVWSDLLLVADNKDRKDGCEAMIKMLEQIKEEMEGLK